MSEIIGYARVSTRDQNLDGQLDLLRSFGCLRIFEDKVCSISEKRPGWDSLMDYIRPDDSIVVTEISRMTRSVPHLFALVKEFEERRINLISLRENIDTTTATGRAFLGMMGVINQMERELRAERTAAGRAAARARGRSGGRPKTSLDLLEKARTLYESGEHTAIDICKTLGIGRRTLYRHLEARRKEGR